MQRGVEMGGAGQRASGGTERGATGATGATGRTRADGATGATTLGVEGVVTTFLTGSLDKGATSFVVVGFGRKTAIKTAPRIARRNKRDKAFFMVHIRIDRSEFPWSSRKFSRKGKHKYAPFPCGKNERVASSLFLVP